MASCWVLLTAHTLTIITILLLSNPLPSTLVVLVVMEVRQEEEDQARSVEMLVLSALCGNWGWESSGC